MNPHYEHSIVKGNNFQRQSLYVLIAFEMVVLVHKLDSAAF